MLLCTYLPTSPTWRPFFPASILPPSSSTADLLVILHSPFSLSARNQTPSSLPSPALPVFAAPGSAPLQPLSPHPRDNDGRPLRLARLAPHLQPLARPGPAVQHLLAILPPSPPPRLFAALVLNCSASAASSPLRSTTPIAIPPSIPSSLLAWSSLWLICDLPAAVAITCRLAHPDGWWS
jgi:hypothetical protein